MTDAADFQRESYRIDERIWDALGLRAGERALFVGIANDGAWIARAVEIGVDVTAIAADDASIARIVQVGARATRGSATLIPASENAYDVPIAMHYLHEIDPGFHGQVLAELARVARRVAIVEPSPPVDALGKRIAALYGRAKREAGLFENYQPIEYWRKLLSIAKAEVWENLFTFTRVPSPAAVAETISLVLDAMAIEEMPARYLDELRALAARKDAQLLPLSRIVLVGTAAGATPQSGSGEPFRPYAGPPLVAPRATEPVAVALPPRPPAPANPFTPTAPLATATAAGFGFAPRTRRRRRLRSIARSQRPPNRRPNRRSEHGAPSTSSRRVRRPHRLNPPRSARRSPSRKTPDEAPFGGNPANGFGWSWEPPDEDRPS